MIRPLAAAWFFLALSTFGAEVPRIPPAGIVVSAEDQNALVSGLAELESAIAEVASHPLLPDVEIYHKAVRDALKYGEFQKPAELNFAKEELKIGLKRARLLKNGEAPWTKERGLVVRGFRSEIDGSVQPYGLVIPESYQFDGDQNFRLDFWFHGRDDTVNEVAFIQRRMTDRGQYTPRDTIVLHPYARFSNANKFAGEIDCLEALEHVQKGYLIDPDRILVRGFSMGGAACWQFAVHYADQWCAANPGAGFAETAEFLTMCDGHRPNPPKFQETLWSLYDCTGYAANLSNLPTIAYSGEIDQQKQAADMMEKAMQERGLALTHLIGPKTAHALEKEAKIEIEKRLDAIAKIGRQNFPEAIRLETYTLRYHKMHWAQIDRMGEHWKRASLEARMSMDGIQVTLVENITALSFRFPAGKASFATRKDPVVEISGQRIVVPSVPEGGAWEVSLVLRDGKWAPGVPSKALEKRHLLQGPIDDAFMGSFLFVAPGKTSNDDFSVWEGSERTRAIAQWRQQFRGDARLKNDTELTDEDLARHHLILWGNPSTNAILARIADKLPIKWDAHKITVGDQDFDAKTHALTMIYPNPLNPDRYVVLNSSFTYREFDYLNNARQVPKLPDWAVIDLSEAPGPERPGKIAAAGFFDEQWRLK